MKLFKFLADAARQYQKEAGKGLKTPATPPAPKRADEPSGKFQPLFTHATLAENMAEYRAVLAEQSAQSTYDPNQWLADGLRDAMENTRRAAPPGATHYTTPLAPRRPGQPDTTYCKWELGQLYYARLDGGECVWVPMHSSDANTLYSLTGGPAIGKLMRGGKHEHNDNDFSGGAA